MVKSTICVLSLVAVIVVIHQSETRSCPNPGLVSPENDFTSNSYPTIKKSPNDPRDFRGLCLRNGMTVLLIRDNSADDGFVALTVAAGGMNEPPDINGLAHLVEHSLFIENENSSNETLNKFLDSNRGSINGMTQKDLTTFYFHVSNSKLSEALHRFAKLFLSPSFRYSEVVNTTIRDIELEYRNQILDSGYQISRVQELLVNPKHPAHQFLIGSSKTLLDDPLSNGVNISEACDEFFKQFYSANLMSLVVGGNYSLDKMQSFVEQEFLDVPNHNISVETSSEPFFSEKELKETAEFKLSTDVMLINLDFMLNESFSTFSQVKKYIRDLLESEHEGGLLNFLHHENWARSIHQTSVELPGLSVLTIQIILTESGFENPTQVLCHVFEYLNDIQRWEPQEWYWNQLRSVGDLEWKFPQSSTTQMEEIINLSHKLSKGTPIEDVLSADKLMGDFNSEEITNLLSLLSNPLNAKVTFIGNFSDDRVPHRDTFYPIQYGYSPVTTSFTDALLNCSTNSFFTMPQREEESLPTDFPSLSVNVSDFQNWDVPHLVKPNSLLLSKVWWWNALTKVPEPRLAVTLIIRSPMANFDPLSRLCSLIFSYLVRDSLTYLTQHAMKSGISVQFFSKTVGLQIEVSGFSDKIPLLIDQILSSVLDNSTTNEVNDETLQIMYLQLQQDIFVGSARNSNPLGQARRTVAQLFSDRTWVKADLQSVHDVLTTNNFLRWKARYFDRVQLEWFFSGNVGPSEAFEIASETEQKFIEAGVRPILFPQSLSISREILLTQGKEWLYMTPSETRHNDSVTQIVFQLGAKWDPFIQVAANILDITEGDAFYKVIRSQHGLGYDVSATVREFRTFSAFILQVQGTQHPAFIEGYIRKFIDSHLLQPSPSDFENYKETLKERLMSDSSQSTPTLVSRHNKFVHKTIDRAPIDDQALLLQALDNITFEQFYEFLQDSFNRTSKLKRQLSVYIVPEYMHENYNFTQEDQELIESKRMITNIVDWKRQQTLHSLYDSQ